MSEQYICRACLSPNVYLCPAPLPYIEEFVNISNISVQVANTIGFCNWCCHYLRKFHKFRMRCLQANSVLNQLLATEFGDSALVINRPKLNPEFVSSQTEIIDVLPSDEPIEQIVGQFMESKPETLEIKFEPENQQLDEHDDYVNGNENDISDSEDDIPLNNLKVLKPKAKQAQKSRDSKIVVHKTKQKRFCKEKTKRGFKEDYASEIILSKEEQIAELNARALSENYINSPYKCSLCFKGFVEMLAYSNHLEKHHEKSGAFECDICHLRYVTARKMRAHSFASHGRQYQCGQCEHRAHTAHQARDHEKWHRGHMYECKLCCQKFRKPTSLLSHMRKQHPTEFVCELCGDSFVSRHGLLMHTSKTHKMTELKITKPDPNSELYCGDCEVQFGTKDAWNNHMVTSVKHYKEAHTGDQCRICAATFTLSSELVRHMRAHGRTIKRTQLREQFKPAAVCDVSCDQCGGQYPSKARLHAHIKRVHLGQKYVKHVVCEVCGKKCTSNATLRYHQRTHTGARPYACVHCPKRFADSTQLKIHARSHTGERPYVCALCRHTFTQKPALNRHMRVHTGAKPYGCQYCAKHFSQSNSLKLHIRTVHLKQPHSGRKNKAQNGAAATERANVEIKSVVTL